MRAALKAGVETLLCAAGAAALGRRRHAGRTLILAYHNIIPAGERAAGDRSLHLSQSDFAAQLDLLARGHDVVPLANLAEPTTGGRPRAVITFDDAYQGTLTAGVAELARRGLPATIFVPPSFLGGGSFWWDALAGDDGMSADVREHALHRLGGEDDRIREWASAHATVPPPLPTHQLCGTEAQLREAVGAGMTLGSHTWSHASLPTLPADRLRRELVDSREWLRNRFEGKGFVDWLAYPYGHTSAAVAIAAEAAGYIGALRVDGGWLRGPAPFADPFDIPRQNIPAGISIRGFELRVAGVTG
jgi:peptidoglycan/xylan/chitin deacetylase (PgdA/CDA1 family)